MTLINWSDEYKTGNRDVDKDHWGLFALINDFHDKAEKGGSETSIGVMITVLEYYVKIHFQREEALLAACKYDGLAEHKEIHRRLEARVQDYRRAFETDPDNFDQPGFTKFLSDWLSDHIMKVDMAYVPAIEGLGRAGDVP